MFEIFLTWIFISIVSYGWGYLFPGIRQFASLPSVARVGTQMLFGMLVLSVFFSLVHFVVPVSSPVVLILVSTVAVLTIAAHRDGLRLSRVDWMDGVFLIFGLAVLMRAAGPIGSQDSGIYHLPYIKWLESYPLVDGLANLHSRFGFNYHYHLLAAFFGLSELAGTTLHALNGFMYISIGMVLYSLARAASDPRSSLAFGAMLGVLALIANGMNSFSPDFPIAAYEMLLLSLILFFHVQKKSKIPYLVLLAASIAIVPLKLSSFTLVIIILLMLDFRALFTRRIWWLFLMGLLVLLPYFFRCYHMTGYLVYPLSAIDLFDPIWKLPTVVVDFERHVVRNYALGLDLHYHGEVHWDRDLLRQWLATARGYNTAGYYAILLMGIQGLLIFVYQLVRRLRGRPMDRVYSMMYLGIMLALFIWMRLGPDPRFVYGYLAVLTGLTALVMTDLLGISQTVARRLCAASIVLSVLVGFFGVFGVSFSSGLDYPQAERIPLWHQAAYPRAPLDTTMQQGHKIYKTGWDDGCWESPLPCSYERDDFILIDSSDISQGFLPGADHSFAEG